jgi:hypothetical protein
VVSLCRTGSRPLGSLVKFLLSLHRFLLTQALPGALDDLDPTDHDEVEALQRGVGARGVRRLHTKHVDLAAGMRGCKTEGLAESEAAHFRIVDTDDDEVSGLVRHASVRFRRPAKARGSEAPRLIGPVLRGQ